MFGLQQKNESFQEHTSKDARYEDMVKIFRPLITKNVLVREILPHLPFIGTCY